MPQDLLLDGEAGIGKTFLWRTGVEATQEAGHRVLVSRPGENEMGLSYSGIGDLIGDVFDEALADAPSLQREALEIALLHREAGALRPDQRAISPGVLGAFRTLSAAGAAIADSEVLEESAYWLHEGQGCARRCGSSFSKGFRTEVQLADSVSR